jgi:hypothetical protein
MYLDHVRHRKEMSVPRRSEVGVDRSGLRPLQRPALRHRGLAPPQVSSRGQGDIHVPYSCDHLYYAKDIEIEKVQGRVENEADMRDIHKMTCFPAAMAAKTSC